MAAAKLIVFMVIIIGQVRILGYRVLMPIALADTLLRVAEKGLYRPPWSGRILAEAQAATEEIHPGMDAGKRFAQMREAFNDAMVTGWQELEPGSCCPMRTTGTWWRLRSRAARRASSPRPPRTSPAAALEPLGLEAVHPDDFLLDQLDLSPPTILQVIRDQAARTRRPPLTPRDLATLLGGAGVPGFADEILRLMANPLDGT